jgi:ATP adenylyltransferase/5',5'''-P-1,P-4-tetraphosphate phosphorylase II
MSENSGVGLHKFHCICLILYFFHVFQVHRLVVVDKYKHVKGIVSLSDILTFLVLKPMGMYRYTVLTMNTGPPAQNQ